MADNFKTYTQAVEDGDILVWAATGDKLAKKERFDANTKFVIDNQAELWNKVNAAMILNAGTTGELNAEVAAQILELQKITANAPIALDTLKEIADSLGNDTDFATTMINQLALKANKIVDHDLVPDTANIRNLGSPEKPFKDLYLSNASLYVDGQQVLSASGDTINVSADEDQNVRITTLGVGDIEIYPKGTGTIELKGTIEVTAGKLVRTSDGTPLLIDGSIDVDGNVVADNLSAVNLNGANINTIISDVNNLKILVQSDDTTLDTLQEVVDYIQLNRSTLQALGISGISGLQTALDNLQIAINTEASTRYNETSANLVKINQETTARTNADTALSQSLTNAIANLTTLINAVEANLTTEAGTRSSADATLGQGIDEANEARLENDNAIIARVEPLESEYNFGKVTVGVTTLTADVKTDTLTLVAGTNVSITADAATDTITINANDTSVNWSEIQNKPDPVVTVTLTGDVTGSANATLTDLASGTVSVATTIAANSVALGTDTTGNYVADVTAGSYVLKSGTAGEGWSPSIAVDATSANTASKVVARDASGDFSAGTITAALSGNAATATKLATARTISLTGGVTGSASFDGSGNISIATTAASSGATISNDTATAATYYPMFATATSGTLTTAKVADTKLTFNPSTGVLSSTSITELSDANLKDNVETLEATIIDSIRPVSFEWKESGTKAYGVIAQELEQVIPEAVFTTEDGKKSVQYTQLIPFLIAEIQELKKEIKLLKGDK